MRRCRKYLRHRAVPCGGDFDAAGGTAVTLRENSGKLLSDLAQFRPKKDKDGCCHVSFLAIASLGA